VEFVHALSPQPQQQLLLHCACQYFPLDVPPSFQIPPVAAAAVAAVAAA